MEYVLSDLTWYLRYADGDVADEVEDIYEDVADMAEDMVTLAMDVLDGSLNLSDVMGVNGVVRDGLKVGDEISDLAGYKNLKDLMSEFGGREAEEMVSTASTVSMAVLIFTWIILIGTPLATIACVMMYLGNLKGNAYGLAIITTVSLIASCGTSVAINIYADETAFMPSFFLLISCVIAWAVPVMLKPAALSEGGGVPITNAEDAKEMLSQFGRKISDVGQGVASQTKNFTESSRLNGQVSSLDRERREFLALLGQAYLDRDPSGAGQNHPEIVGQINNTVKKIQEAEAQIKSIKGTDKCGKCGNDIPMESTFCNKCGTPKAQAAPGQVPCGNCGNAMNAGSPFCNKCGAPAGAPAAAAVCPHCQQPKVGDSPFCVHCGKSV